uniref:Uncharacterized protein n=1 Tax=Cucumis melo TaxID=3656 RepID=A0A9I9DST7_CUCME
MKDSDGAACESREEVGVQWSVCCLNLNVFKEQKGLRRKGSLADSDGTETVEQSWEIVRIKVVVVLWKWKRKPLICSTESSITVGFSFGYAQ